MVADSFPMNSEVRIGDFTLLSHAGSGAHADVFRGQHALQDYPVAIKIPKMKRGRSARVDDRFFGEIRAIARLQHPGVIRIFDYGRLNQTFTMPNVSPCEKGTPYFVMEWIEGGTLNSVHQDFGWPQLRSTLLVLLDALAAAHARGIIHRDIKPDNILISERGPIISDFGVALLPEEEGGESERPSVVGTPTYMSPEQIRANLHACGPWTDLYALGCMVYRLVSGRRPFEGRDYMSVIQGHLKAPMPPLDPQIVVPKGLENWIGRLMEKSIGRRYQLAADAALALIRMSEDLSDVLNLPPMRGVRIDAKAIDRDTLFGSTLANMPLFFLPAPQQKSEGKRSQSVPDVPDSWDSVPSSIDSAPQRTMSRSLFSWTHSDFCGRVAERDLLWRNLRQVSDENRARAVAVFGEAGLGKTALANWLCERAHAIGAALPIRVRHEFPNGASCGLPGVITSALRLTGQPEAIQRRVIKAFCSEHGLTRFEHVYVYLLNFPNGAVEGGAVTGVITLATQFEALAALIAPLTRLRPRILVIDDLQWASDGLGFLDHLLRTHQTLPLFIVCTVRSDLLHRTHPARVMLNHLEAQAGLSQLILGQLSKPVQRQMLANRLDVEPSTLERLLERTQGNPLFLEASIRHWINQGKLVPTQLGYRAASTAQLDLAPSINSLWKSRLETLIAADSNQWLCLELAATLGMRVGRSELLVGCENASLQFDFDLLEALMQHRLIEADDDGFAFAHVLLRDFLLNYAARRGRAKHWHAVCAALISKMEPDSFERIGTHLFESGAFADAVSPLSDSIRRLHRQVDLSGLRRTVIKYLRALKASGVRRASVQWLWGRNIWNYCNRVSGFATKARYSASRAVLIAEGVGDANTLFNTLVEYGLCLEITGDYAISDSKDSPYSIYHRVKGIAGDCSHADAVIYANLRLAECLLTYGRYDEVRPLMTEVLNAKLEYPRRREDCIEGLKLLATACLGQEDLQGAEQAISDAFGLYDTSIGGWHKAWLDYYSAMLWIKKKAFDRAEVDFNKALDQWGRLGHSDCWFGHLGLACIHGERGDWQSMSRGLQALSTLVQEYNLGYALALVSLHKLRPFIELGQWTRFDDVLADLSKCELGIVRLEYIQVVVTTARRLSGVDMADRSQRMRSLIAQLYKKHPSSTGA